MNIAVFGLGYVGSVAAACLSRRGHCVYGVDPEESKLANSAPFPSSTKIPDNFQDYDTALVCVGTPSREDGAHDLSFIKTVTQQIAMAASGRDRQLTLVYRSTVRPGTMDEVVRPILFEAGVSDIVEVIYYPEFLREAHAEADFYSPTRIIVGTASGQYSERFRSLIDGLSAPIFSVTYKEAELIKLMDNTFHALKVTFANEIGRVCDSLGVSYENIYEMFVADTRLNISAAYLKAGGAFGGSCLPKDVRALQHLAAEIGASTQLIDSIMVSNEAHKRFREP